jgi:hypothetical protein
LQTYPSPLLARQIAHCLAAALPSSWLHTTRPLTGENLSAVSAVALYPPGVRRPSCALEWLCYPIKLAKASVTGVYTRSRDEAQKTRIARTNTDGYPLSGGATHTRTDLSVRTFSDFALVFVYTKSEQFKRPRALGRSVFTRCVESIAVQSRRRSRTVRYLNTETRNDGGSKAGKSSSGQSWCIGGSP